MAGTSLFEEFRGFPAICDFGSSQTLHEEKWTYGSARSHERERAGGGVSSGVRPLRAHGLRWEAVCTWVYMKVAAIFLVVAEEVRVHRRGRKDIP
jgi:hypothetical protein